MLEDLRPFAIRLRETTEEPHFLVKTNGDKQAKAAFWQMLRDLGCSEEALQWSMLLSYECGLLAL